MERVLLVDGDITVFQVAAAAEHECKWDEDLWTLHAFENEAKQTIDAWFKKLKVAAKADKVIVALSSDTNFRYEVLDTYKHNRATTRPPMLRKVLKEYVYEKHNALIFPDLEGDDVLGILMTHPTMAGGKNVEKVCVSIDKDMKTIAGKHLRLNDAYRMIHSGEISSIDEAIFTVSDKEAAIYHYTQTLTGDTTDGYKGCPSVGVKTAAKIIQAVEEECSLWANDEQWHSAMWDAIVETYHKKNLSEEVALQQARVAHICNHNDYDLKRKKVKLWNPIKV